MERKLITKRRKGKSNLILKERLLYHTIYYIFMVLHFTGSLDMNFHFFLKKKVLPGHVDKNLLSQYFTRSYPASSRELKDKCK